MPYGNWNMDMGWGGGLLMLVLTLLFLGGFLLIAASIVHQHHQHHHHDFDDRGHSHQPSSNRSGPLNILDERFARGDIDEDEYKRRRELL